MSWSPVLATLAVVTAAVALRLGAGQPLTATPRIVERWSRRREHRAIAAALPVLCEEVARSLRAGATLRAALIDVDAPGIGPALRRDLDRLRAHLGAGADVEGALDGWAARRGSVQGVALVVAALTLAAQSGGAMARSIDGVADTLRADAAIGAEVRSLASQAEASAALVAMLPLVFGLMAVATEPARLSFLIRTRLGLGCLIAGLLLDAVGVVWMRRIVGRVG